MDTTVLLALIKDKELPVERGLKLMPYIHSGFLELILDKPMEQTSGI